VMSAMMRIELKESFRRRHKCQRFLSQRSAAPPLLPAA
jgi:hypothetical protein